MCLFNNRLRLVNSVTFRKLTVVVLTSAVILLYQIIVYSASSSFENNFRGQNSLRNHELYVQSYNIVNTYYTKRQSWRTSNLGSILFKNVKKDNFKKHNGDNKRFLVLIWEHWSWLRGRHVQSFNKSRKTHPLSQCSVKNCIFTGNNSILDIADAVVVHIQKGVFPDQKNRKKEQRWIFLNDESPVHAFSMAAEKPNLSLLADIFNWSMTYRSEADVPVPYGRTIPLSQLYYTPGPAELESVTSKIPFWNEKQKDVLAAILISNCGVSQRMRYLRQLKQHIAVDIHGKCAAVNKTSCPGHFRSDCGVMARYLFYLVFENSMCKEYLTEKGFYHAYSKGAIPIIMGPSLEDCDKLLPPNSFLHVDNFKSPLDLANEIVHISENLYTLLSYHQWRNYFEVVNEHGYFGSRSFHFCRVCEALNYNSEEEKIYSEDDLKEFLDPSRTCRLK